MIPSNTPSSVNWTTSTAPVSPAVPAVMAVAPAAPAARDAQAGLEQRRGQARTAAAQAAGSRDAGATQEDRSVDAERAARDARMRAEHERSLQREQEQRETMEQLRQALRRVWDASGAVVEQALAREREQAGLQPGNRARSLDAYDTPAEPTDRPPPLSRRV